VPDAFRVAEDLPAGTTVPRHAWDRWAVSQNKLADRDQHDCHQRHIAHLKELTDYELDLVAGGQGRQDGLVNLNVSHVAVAIPVNAAVAAGVLYTSPVAAGVNRPGAVNQQT
jgi:hypothetical protein